MVNKNLLLSMLLALAACATQRSDAERLQEYQSKLYGYSCDQLAAEQRINDKMIGTFQTAHAAHEENNIGGDLLLNTLTLGSDHWEDGGSMSENSNERKRIGHYQQRNQMVLSEQQKRCPL